MKLKYAYIYLTINKAYLTMDEVPFIIGVGAGIYMSAIDINGNEVIMNLPPRVGSKLYVPIENGNGKYTYIGTVTKVEKAGTSKFGHIGDWLNIFIPHESSPVDSHLEVGMAQGDALKVTVDFIVPEQIISICGVKVRLSKTMGA